MRNRSEIKKFKSKNQGTKANRIIFAVAYSDTEVPVFNPSEIAAINIKRLSTLNFLKTISQPAPPVTEQKSNPSLIDCPRESPTNIPNVGRIAAPGGRRLHFS